MGLDVWLYKYSGDKMVADRLTEEYESKTTAVWNQFGDRKHESLTENEKDKARSECAAIAAALGLKKHGELPEEMEKKIEIPSPSHPDHYFKIGYFRSSYNGSGIDHVLGNIIGVTLGDLFPGHNEDYCFRPDWEESLGIVKEAIGKFDKHVSENGAYRCFAVSSNIFSPQQAMSISNEKAALSLFYAEIERNKNRKGLGDDESYSNNKGEFFLNGITCHAFIPGTQTIFNANPCTYVVFKDNGIEWYREALEIVQETIEYVLNQPDKDKYYLHWSG